ncbi:MAG: hypothetical protein AAGB28_13440 [Pseudomonadota bacterium]
MLVFKAIPLSFAILWRYLLVFPFVLIALALYGLVGGLLGALLGFISPPLYVLVIFFFGVSSGLIPLMVGSRLGLQSKHVAPRSGYGKIVVPSLIYGVVEALSIGFVAALAFGASFVFTAFDITGLSSESQEFFNALDARHISVFGMAILATFLAICALRAALLVPIAAASVGVDPDGRPYTPFFNFGAFFWPLFMIVAISYIGMTVLFAASFLGIGVLTATGVMTEQIAQIEQMIDGTAPFGLTPTLIGFVILFVVLACWGFCFQCAGGVLGFMQLSDSPKSTIAPSEPITQHSVQPATSSGGRLTSEELRALRKSRQLSRMS